MSTAILKRIALVSMVIDHIAVFVPGMPIQMRWIGRLSAPLFLYVFVHSIEHTKNKETFIQRLYGVGILTSILVFCFNLLPRYQNPFDIITSNIFSTYVAIFLLIDVMERVRNKAEGWLKKLVEYCLWQIVSTIIITIVAFGLPKYQDAFTLLLAQISGNIFFNEGRLFFVVLGVGLYYAKKTRLSTAVVYMVILGLHITLTLCEIPQKIYVRASNTSNCFIEFACERFFGTIGYDVISFNKVHPLYNHFEWMMIFALPIMLLYNGKKGKYNKYFYYIFYPAHLAVLLCIQQLI